MLNSYPSIYNLGHAAVAELTNGPVIVQEKVDGSQFSFGFMDGGLQIRSKGAEIHVDAPDSMFKEAVETVKRLHEEKGLTFGWTYRGEYLKKPRHNALAYDRVPVGHIILFDINTGLEEYISYDRVKSEADRLGLEVVPMMYEGIVTSPDQLKGFLEQTSVLEGQKIEGVVLKPLAYDVYGKDKKVLMGKFVSEAYKEVHSAAWKEANPGQGDIISTLLRGYKTPARWNKAIQHLEDAGQLEGSPRDIGKLIAEIGKDVEKEEVEAIKEYLYKWAWPQVKRGLAGGFAEYYKEKLLAKQFEGQPVV